MKLKFAKMHGLGNDFIVIDAINQKVDLKPHVIAQLSRRDIGIGFDQCLLVEASTTPEIDFFYRIFNADGQEVGQCGNGARCLALFVKHYQLTNKSTINVATSTTTMQLHINPDNSVSVAFAQPKLEPKDIPMLVDKAASKYEITLENGSKHTLHTINVGNPHAVLVVDHWPIDDISVIGNAISNHPIFPQQANVGFMYIENPSLIHLRVYERGSSETQACGSGAVAAVAIGRLYHQLSDEVNVSLPGGELMVSWPNIDSSIFLTGPATFVYEGHLIS